MAVKELSIDDIKDLIPELNNGKSKIASILYNRKIKPIRYERVCNYYIAIYDRSQVVDSFKKKPFKPAKKARKKPLPNERTKLQICDELRIDLRKLNLIIKEKKIKVSQQIVIKKRYFNLYDITEIEKHTDEIYTNDIEFSRPEKPRNIDCVNYIKCISNAAKLNIKMDCSGCDKYKQDKLYMFK